LSLTDLSERFAAQIAPLLPAHSSILIGLSGGIDSVVLRRSRRCFPRTVPS